MTMWNRRRALQAALASVLASWSAARAQQRGRTLQAAPRPQSGPVTAGGSLLIAPRRALVIGNSSYSVGALRNPANDARAIAEELKGQGFEVTLGLDLRRDEMLQLIGAYSQALAQIKPVALFYFAGHGLQLAWRNYLVPVDAAITQTKHVQERCVDVNSVIEGIGKAANPMNVIILDACRDNPFGREARAEQKGLSQLDAPPGTLLAYATSPGNIASDGDGANGLYTEHLLREMKVPEAKIEDVFKRVRLGVRRRSNGQQIPWESTSLEEDFWFIPPKEQLRLAQEEAERVRREQEAERIRQQRLEQARREELERLRQEQEAERARQEELQRARLEQLEKAREAQLERRYAAEFALWEKVDGAKEPGPLEEYLRRYPSGRFAELAQMQLDRVLAAQGEKKIEIVSATGNPYTQGTAVANTGFRVGDSYTYLRIDRDSGERRRTGIQTVTQISETEVTFTNGLVLDRLGNVVRQAGGRQYTPRQDQPLEYAVGKKWSTRFRTTTAQGKGADSEFTFRITRREKVTVPAGTFDCFVIEGKGYSYTDRGLKIELGLNRWMAPDKVRRPIVSEQFRRVEGRVGGWGRADKAGQFLNNERFELVAFSQS